MTTTWFDVVVGRIVALMPHHKCVICGRRFGGEVTVIPAVGEPSTRKFAAKGQPCTACVDVAPLRLELREPADGAFPPPDAWIESIRAMVARCSAETESNHLQRLGGVN